MTAGLSPIPRGRWRPTSQPVHYGSFVVAEGVRVAIVPGDCVIWAFDSIMNQVESGTDRR